uniref:Uncharacterized protein n=1 Tax=Anguilla anguilla TaxID=7936 RepID=A0A0E9QS52_ANGAN
MLNRSHPRVSHKKCMITSSLFKKMVQPNLKCESIDSFSSGAEVQKRTSSHIKYKCTSNSPWAIQIYIRLYQ